MNTRETAICKKEKKGKCTNTNGYLLRMSFKSFLWCTLNQRMTKKRRMTQFISMLNTKCNPNTSKSITLYCAEDLKGLDVILTGWRRCAVSTEGQGGQWGWRKPPQHVREEIGKVGHWEAIKVWAGVALTRHGHHYSSPTVKQKNPKWHSTWGICKGYSSIRPPWEKTRWCLFNVI